MKIEGIAKWLHYYQQSLGDWGITNPSILLSLWLHINSCYSLSTAPFYGEVCSLFTTSDIVLNINVYGGLKEYSQLFLNHGTFPSANQEIQARKKNKTKKVHLKSVITDYYSPLLLLHLDHSLKRNWIGLPHTHGKSDVSWQLHGPPPLFLHPRIPQTPGKHCRKAYKGAVSPSGSSEDDFIISPGIQCYLMFQKPLANLKVKRLCVIASRHAIFPKEHGSTAVLLYARKIHRAESICSFDCLLEERRNNVQEPRWESIT